LPGEGEAAPEGVETTDNPSYDFDAELNKLNKLSQSESQEISAEQLVEDILPSTSDDTDDFLNRLAGVETDPQPIVEFEIPQSVFSINQTTDKLYSPLEDLLASTSSLSDEIIPDIPTVPIEVPEETGIIPANSLNTSNADIEQLLAVTQNKPDDHFSWQRLGDAYAGVGRYTDALYAYSKAEQILIKLS
jgi:tetratricopeptide (TPR) repeat protein